MTRIVGWRDAQADPAFLDAWRALEDVACEPNPFFSPAVVLAAARHLEGGSRMSLLVEQDPDGTLRFLLPVVDALPRALAPLEVRLDRRGVGLTGLRTWLHPYCFLGTPLLDGRTDPVALWRRVLDGLQGREERRGRGRGQDGAADRRPWCELPMLAAHGPVATALRTALGDREGVVHEDLGERGCLRRRPEADYLARATTSKQRSNLSRRRRHLAAAVDRLHCVDRAEDTDDLAVALEEFLELEARGWKGAQGTALAARPHHAAFVREALTALAQDKRVVLLSLDSAQGSVAQSIALRGGTGEFGFKRAYDPEHARHSPGGLLDVDMLERFHRGGAEWLDTCSYPGLETHDVFVDRYPMTSVVVGTSTAGRVLVGRLWPALDLARTRLHGTRAGEWLRGLRRPRRGTPVTGSTSGAL